MINILLIVIAGAVLFFLVKAAQDALVLLIIGAIVALVHVFSLFYFGIPGAVFTGTLVSLASALIWTGLKVSSFNKELIFIRSFALCLIAMALVTFGLHHLVLYYRTGELNEWAFFTWLAVMVLPPCAITAYDSLKKARAKRHKEHYYIHLSFEIFHYNDYPLHIDQVSFKNTVTGLEVNVKVPHGKFYHQEEVLQMETEERIRVFDISVFHDTVNVPIGTDQLYLEYYSYVENRLYADRFPITLDEYTTAIKHTGEKRLKSIKFCIKPEGKANIIIARETSIPCIKVGFTEPSQERILQYRKHFFVHDKGIQASEVPSIIQEIKKSGRLLEREEMLEREYMWHLTIESPGKTVNVSVTDFRYLVYSSTYRWFHKLVKKQLPASFQFYIYNANNEAFANLYINLDKPKFYRLINKLTKNDISVPLEILIRVKELGYEDIEVIARALGKEAVFEEKTMNIVRYDSVAAV